MLKGSLIALVGVEVVIGELLCRTTSNNVVYGALLGGYLVGVIITMRKWSAFHTKNEVEELLHRKRQCNQIN